MKKWCAFFIVIVSLSCPLWALDEFVGPFSTWMNVKTLFGATGNGTTDDQPALQRALDSLCYDNLRVVYLPAGTYRITKKLELPRHVSPHVGTYEPIGSRVVGEDPTKVTLLWDGPTDSNMIWLDGFSNGTLERITFDGNTKASACILELWSKGGYGNATTFTSFVDLAFKNAKYGIRSPTRDGQMDAEQHMDRLEFTNITNTAIQINSNNTYNWFVWNSKFTNCGIGVEAVPVYGLDIFVYNCNFYNSRVADVYAAKSVRECYSSGSRVFYKGSRYPGTSIYSNKIVNTINPVSVDLTNWDSTNTYAGRNLIHFVDNVIVSSPGTVGPVVKNLKTNNIYNSLVAVGNTFTVTNPLAASFLTSVDNQTVANPTVTAPVLPGFRPNLNRRIFESPTTTSWLPCQLQVLIDSAVAYEEAHPGSSPVVHAAFGRFGVSGGQYSSAIPTTITIPANTDIQIVGDNHMRDPLYWTGPFGGTMFRITGPTKVSISNLTFFGTANPSGTASAAATMISLENCDQVGSRLFMEDMFLPGEGAGEALYSDTVNMRYGLYVNGANNIDVVAHSYFTGTAKVVGGSDAAGTSSVKLFGTANVSGFPSFEVVNGGRLLVQDAYSEMFWGAYRYLYAHGVGAHPGQFVSDYQTLSSDAPVGTVGVKIEDFPGYVSILDGWYHGTVTGVTTPWDSVNRMRTIMTASTSTIAAQMNLCGLASIFYRPGIYPANAHIGIINYFQSNTINAPSFLVNVPDSMQFIRDAMAFRRASKHAVIPLASVASGASDIRLYRNFLNPIRVAGVYVQGSGTVTPPPPPVQPLDLLINGGFENSTTGWSFSGAVSFALADSVKHSGVRAVRLSGVSALGTSTIAQWPDMYQGKIDSMYQLSFWCKVTPGTQAVVYVSLNVDWGTSYGDSLVVSDNSATWKQYKINIPVTAEPQGLIQSYVTCKVASGTGYVYADDFSLRSISISNTRLYRHTAPVFMPQVFAGNRMIAIRNIPVGAHVNLFDVQGKMVASVGSLLQARNDNGVCVFRTLPRGVYVVNIINGKEIVTKKVVLFY